MNNPKSLILLPYLNNVLQRFTPDDMYCWYNVRSSKCKYDLREHYFHFINVIQILIYLLKQRTVRWFNTLVGYTVETNHKAQMFSVKKFLKRSSIFFYTIIIYKMSQTKRNEIKLKMIFITLLLYVSES